MKPSTDPVSHLKITAAGVIALFVTVVGQVVAFVPSLKSREETLISVGSVVISAVFLVANAVHAQAGAKQAAVPVVPPK